MIKELKNEEPYREFSVNYETFKEALNPQKKTIETELLEKLTSYSKRFLEQQGMQINWRELSKLKSGGYIFIDNVPDQIQFDDEMINEVKDWTGYEASGGGHPSTYWFQKP